MSDLIPKIRAAQTRAAESLISEELAAAGLVDAAPVEVLSFDDMGMGYTDASRRCLLRRIEPSRPPGLTNAQWYEYAGSIIALVAGAPLPRRGVPE